MTPSVKNIFQKHPLIVVFIIAIILVAFAAWSNSITQGGVQVTVTQDSSSTPIISSIIPSSTILNTPSITQTQVLSITSVSSLESTPWPFLPTPFAGTIGPDGFEVKKWLAKTCEMGEVTPLVLINGVIISDDYIPYKFTFQQANKVIVPVFTYYQSFPPSLVSLSIHNSHLERIIVFETPIKIKKDQYVHITIDFQPEENEISWIDDLLYLAKKTNCSGK